MSISKADKLKELKAKREKMEAEEKNRLLLEGENEKIEAELLEEERKLRDLEDQKALREAYRKYGNKRVARLDTSEGMLILRGYTGAEWEELQAQLRTLNGEEAEANAIHEANIKLVIHPDEARARQIVDMFPMIRSRMDLATTLIAQGAVDKLLGKA